MRTILVPIDFSATSEKAVRYTEEIFVNEPVELRLIYVLPTSSDLAEAEVNKSFVKFEQDVLKKSELPYHFAIVKGNLLDEIQRSIEHYRPLYVIMGTNKAELAKALVKLTDSPVMVIPEGSDRNKISTIAYANDFNNIRSSEALKPLLNLSRAFGAKVHIIHVCKDDAVLNDNAESTIEYYLDHVDHEYVYIRTDDFVKSIQDYARDKNIDLLALLIRDHGNNDTHSEGSLIEQLVAKAEVPVLSLV